MADLLALSWDRHRLTGIEVSPVSGGPRILGAFSVDWPEQPPTANWLRETLRRFGVNAKQVTLALPREDAVLRLLELPAVSDDELPTLVRFQAAARSAQSLDQLLLDYLPLPLREGVAQKEVWLATAVQTTVDPIRKLLVDAGLDLVQLTLSSLCLTELIARGEARQSMDSAGASLVVLRDRARMELAVVSQRQLIAAHAVKWSSVNDIPPVSKMLAEVSRVLVQVQAWLPEGTLQRAWVIGDDNDVGELPEALGRRWNCPVQRFDPWRDSGISLGSTKPEGPASEFAIAAGLALIQSGPLSPKLDLLHPRQPPPKRNPRKPLYAAAAAAGLLVAALGTGVVQQSLAGYETKIEEMRIDESKLKQELKAGEPVFIAAKALDDWQSRSTNQLQQIAELHDVMKGTERLVISDYKIDPNIGDVVAKISAVGHARNRFDAEQFFQRLAELPKFRNGIRPKPITQTNRDPDYSSRFELDMDLVPARIKTPTTVKAAGQPPIINPITK
jgi:Tfp pilus assembly PilM family ATPase